MDRGAALESRIDALPSPSPVLGRIRGILADPDSSAADVVDALKLDPVISGRTLRLANSAYIGIPRTVSSLQNAVVLLGMRRIHALVMGVAVGGIMPRHTDSPLSLADFWKHSVTVGIVCESVARHLRRYEPIDEGESFCAGLLHDIGKLVAAVCNPASVRDLAEFCRRSGGAYCTNERGAEAHTAVGGLLAKRWAFPPDLAAAVEKHHVPSEERTFTRLVAVVHLCDTIAHLLGLQVLPGEAVPPLDEQAIAIVGLEPERLRVIARDALDDERRLESMMQFFG
ncbi:MAG: HDOD domain-containing protein [Chitinivibrionales bacterium]|nr:HDOD domain-containing protein [Chitinivibrionales bacterium]MBD3356970.1 HDOD domain-containing protein [Chitinivibrionales bacterium]